MVNVVYLNQTRPDDEASVKARKQKYANSNPLDVINREGLNPAAYDMQQLSKGKLVTRIPDGQNLGHLSVDIEFDKSDPTVVTNLKTYNRYTNSYSKVSEIDPRILNVLSRLNQGVGSTTMELQITPYIGSNGSVLYYITYNALGGKYKDEKTCGGIWTIQDPNGKGTVLISTGEDTDKYVIAAEDFMRQVDRNVFASISGQSRPKRSGNHAKEKIADAEAKVKEAESRANTVEARLTLAEADYNSRLETTIRQSEGYQRDLDSEKKFRKQEQERASQTLGQYQQRAREQVAGKTQKIRDELVKLGMFNGKDVKGRVLELLRELDSAL